MKEIPCIFCGIKSIDTVIEENGYQGKRCPECELIYISPRPSLEEIVDLYGHNNAHITAEEHISDEYRKRLYARHHLRKLKRFAHSGALLEIGAGAGLFLDEARKSGFEPYGLEFNPQQAEFMRTDLGIPCEEKPLTVELYNGIKFDVIYHCDVISHLYNPLDDFRTMNSLLNENGILFFETGNFAEIARYYYSYIATFMYPDHLFFFSLRNLKTLLNQTGFELVYVKRYSILPQFWFKQKFGQKPGSTPAGNQAGNQGESRDGVIANAKVWVNYGLRYYAGSVLPNQNRPQTILIGAKKIT